MAITNCSTICSMNASCGADIADNNEIQRILHQEYTMAYLVGIRRWPLVSNTLFFKKNLQAQCAWTSGVRPSVADTLTLQQCFRVYQIQNTSFIQKWKYFWGAVPLPRLHPSRGNPFPHSLPRPRLDRQVLDQPLAHLFEILNKPLGVW